jgi:uncharacterized protein (DUF3084 family)
LFGLLVLATQKSRSTFFKYSTFRIQVIEPLIILVLKLKIETLIKEGQQLLIENKKLWRENQMISEENQHVRERVDALEHNVSTFLLI